MRKLIDAVLLAGCLSYACPLAAQLNCTVVVNSPEDQLMLAVNGADNPQDQVSALDKYVQAHADSTFMPCVNASYTAAYLKLNNFDKAIEYGEKDFTANTADINVMLNLLRAYVGAGNASDAAFDIINKVPDEIKKESNPSRPEKMNDADWQKAQQDLAEQTKDERAYGEYAFFQLLPRVTEPTKQIQFLDSFMTSYPDTPNVSQVNFQYFIAYKRANNAAKADEYGEKSIASDPNNVATLNLVADDYATRQTNLDKATQYATKVLQLAPAMKKPDGMTDADFKTNQNNQLGLAHTTLGYIAFLKAGKTRKVAPAIQEFKTAVDLLGANPELQGKALYFLGSAYEFEYPPNHKAAADALGRVAGPWQGQAQGLLAKVKKAEHR